MRHMSFALTTPQVRERTKDVTRRLGWLHLKPFDLIQPVVKCMGLRAGEKVERIGGPVRVLSVRRERLDLLLCEVDYGFREVAREGFASTPPVNGWPSAFVEFFTAANRCTPETEVTRIEFSYDLLDGWAGMHIAPMDGSTITLLVRHPNWIHVEPADRDEWQGLVHAHWAERNGGGWSWSGMAGEPIAWRAA